MFERPCPVWKWKRLHKENIQLSSFNFHLYDLFLLYTLCRQGTVRPLFPYTALTQAICGNGRGGECARTTYTGTHSEPRRTGIYITFVHEWITFITSDPKREESENEGNRRKKAGSSLCFFFSSLYSFQAFPNVILTLLLEVWFTKEREREREMKP